MLTRASSNRNKNESLLSVKKDTAEASILNLFPSPSQTPSLPSSSLSDQEEMIRLLLQNKKRSKTNEKLSSLEDIFENDIFRVNILETSYFGLIGTWKLKLVSTKWRTWMTCHINGFGRILQIGGQSTSIQIFHQHDPTVPTVCCLNLATMKWELESSLPLSRAGSSACFLPAEATLIVAGGHSRGLHGSIDASGICELVQTTSSTVMVQQLSKSRSTWDIQRKRL